MGPISRPIWQLFILFAYFFISKVDGQSDTTTSAMNASTSTTTTMQNSSPGISCTPPFIACPDLNYCIFIAWFCDGEIDCLDGGDEDPLLCALVPCDNGQFRCSSQQCIPGNWICDGDNDCSDGEDESAESCGSIECDDDYHFTCDDGTCVPFGNTCDGEEHCPTGEDELPDNCNNCPGILWSCNDGFCIYDSWVCDNEYDCFNGEDEDESVCGPASCSSNQFTCPTGTPRCIPSYWICDDFYDCEDGMDEHNCVPGQNCTTDQFACSNSNCVPTEFRCDHNNDCADGSDETQCTYPECTEAEFSCSNGRCISSNYTCDGYDDCRDNSDETLLACATCTQNQFPCSSGEQRCVHRGQICDGTADCMDGSDEICGLDNCTSVCEHQNCLPIAGFDNFECVCGTGYTLVNGTRCRDIDECRETPWVCSQQCVNHDGSYACHCVDGYTLSFDANNSTCKHTSGVEPVIYFTNRYYLRSLSYDGRDYSLVAEGFEVGVAFDFDYRDGKFYILEILSNSIERMNIDGSGRETIVTDIDTGEGIAIDWVGRKLYWVDRAKDIMVVSELDGSLPKTLLHQNLNEPRGIAVHPKLGLLFYSDWGFDAYIGVVGMDGSPLNKTRIADRRIVWPGGLTIDYTSDKLFWTDAHFNIIVYANFDGSDMFVLTDPPAASLVHPFDVSVFEDWIYWTEWNTPSVHRAHKFTGRDYEPLLNLSIRPYDIQVYHPLKQDQSLVNPCGSDNGGCSHLCLIARGGETYTCACPDLFDLDTDGRTCLANCVNIDQHFLCTDNSKCIPSYWKCDGNADCRDGSDEPSDCHIHCDPRNFQCDNFNCLLPNQICNGNDDCGDNSDERGCNSTICAEWEVPCANGQCIHERLICNGQRNCPSNSDEEEDFCLSTDCAQGYFHCANGLCIPQHWVCDIDNDCGDFSDEPLEFCQMQTCEDGWFSCATNYRCVPEWLVCYGGNNCRDNSDEDICATEECETGYFRCDNNVCIPDRWRCNFVNNCGDNSDEGTICVDNYRDCSEFEFRCESEQCIIKSKLCDQETDCRDGDDELNCELHECLVGQFQCDSGHCINSQLMCDGDAHCSDLSDEINCPTRYPDGRHCFYTEFTCDNTICIPSYYVCDNWEDCGDGSDETVEACFSVPCMEDYFRCTNGQCIPNRWLCDQDDDCGDQSDENDYSLCPIPTPDACNDDEFRCSSGQCVFIYDVCDGVSDCEDFSDELCFDGPCTNANCTQNCTDIGDSHACFCNEGYESGDKPHVCEDIDECSGILPCMQVCTNAQPAYYCDCVDGYTMVAHGGCIPSQGDRILIKSLGDRVRFFNMETSNFTDTWLLPFSWVESIDFIPSKNMLFWIDTEQNVLGRSPVDRYRPTVYHLPNAKRPRLVAVDFLSGNVYWTDLGQEDIVANIDDHVRISVTDLSIHQTLVTFATGVPTALAVNPRNGLMYWFTRDTVGSSAIEIAWMNGENRRRVETHLRSVVGISIDYAHHDVVYLTDANNYIYSMNYDGTFLNQLRRDSDLQKPLRMDVFGSFIYWTSHEGSGKILALDKLGRGITFLYQAEDSLPIDVKIYHSLRYAVEDMSDPCEESLCSHLCLTTPSIDGIHSRPRFKCACPDGLHLKEGDALNCIEGPGTACLNDYNGGCSHNCTTDSQDMPVCHCPEGLKLANGKRVCVDLEVECPSNSFTCTNGLCIPESWRCDVDNDCGDGSDETWSICYDHTCQENQFTCNNNRCIPSYYLCDYYNDCRDGSDEQQQDCDFEECPPGDFECGTHECIDTDNVCDGQYDCTDISDESLNCSDTSPEPCFDFFFYSELRCPGNNLCIPEIWHCDGEDDCGDNSDEDPAYCGAKTCGPYDFKCDNGGCIPGLWHCDNYMDCLDGADEPENCDDPDRTCIPEHFKCDSGLCIPDSWICDQYDDCGDAGTSGFSSDETPEQCESPPPCLGDTFMCEMGKPFRCIPLEYVCDGDADCQEAEDEQQNCTFVECDSTEFTCDNSLCVPLNDRCDHVNDCGDASDERECESYSTCNPYQFQCSNGRCVPTFYTCDDFNDCLDNSDEVDCDGTSGCNGFKCTSFGCLPLLEWVCDDENDCADGSDEMNCDRDECAEIASNQCEHICIDTTTSFKCMCNPGFVLNEDQLSCRDIDECRETPWVCNNVCENEYGSYLCKCGFGYSLSEGTEECRRDTEEEPFVYFTNRHYIRKLAVDGTEYSLVADGYHVAEFFDYDRRDQKLYVMDSSRGVISTVTLDGTVHDTIITVVNGRGLAVDWIARKIYWLQKNQSIMSVAELDGSLRKTLVHEGLVLPNAIAVNPQNGYVFWTDSGADAYIGRTSMDGKGVPLKFHNDKLVEPLGLSIDYSTGKIFWVDSRADYIGHSDFDGENFHQIPIPVDNSLYHPYAVAVFEEYVYWTEWDQKAVLRAHKFTGANKTQLLSLDHHRPYDIHVYHSYQQFDIPNPCADDNGGCTHLCLIAEFGGAPSCACPDGFELQEDGVRCIPRCSSYQVACADGSKCIPSYLRCDFVDDCADGSDEPETCLTPSCTRGLFTCTDGPSCISPFQICDGIQDCPDNADEMCELTVCHDWEFRCATGNCIPAVYACDQTNDCTDGSDEDAEMCLTRNCEVGYFKCDNGFCIPEMWRCDYKDDCGDNSDEPFTECQRLSCQLGWFSCMSTYQCVPPYAVCDGVDDCNDKSDETDIMCGDRACDSGDFKCADNTCIPSWWRCDFSLDCSGGDDEEMCEDGYRECSENEFECSDRMCIPSFWKCNGFVDCVNGTDEQNCSDNMCDDNYFQCVSGHCVPSKSLCDGVLDCFDNSDELDCPPRYDDGSYCLQNEFTCDNTLCVSELFTCDDKDDCGDGSDETISACRPGACNHEDLFQCGSGKCVPIWETCDTIANCEDGSDETEELCILPPVCATYEFLCSSAKKCIPKEFQCDRYEDCGQDDENYFCSYVARTCADPICVQACTDVTMTDGNYTLCSCYEGYRVNSQYTGDRHCDDIDECVEDSPCIHQCENTKGGYKCLCSEGYRESNSSGLSVCVIESGDKPRLIYTDGSQLRFFNYGTNRAGFLVTGEGRIDSIDIDSDTGTVVWTDLSLKVIKKAVIPTSSDDDTTTADIIVDIADLSYPTGISVDFMGRNIYWIDQGSLSYQTASEAPRRRKRDVEEFDGPRLSVATLDGENRKTLIEGIGASPGDIVVNPRRGYMYWTNRGGDPKIEWAWMNGQNREILVDTALLDPSGLTIDFARNDDIYFCDRKANRIEVMAWDGSDRRLLAIGPHLQQPVGIEVFESSLYWSTSDHSVDSSGYILKMDKLGRTAPVVEVMGINLPAGLKMSHPLRYFTANSINPCEEAGCSSLCLATPDSGFSCACANGDDFISRDDNRNCIYTYIPELTTALMPELPTGMTEALMPELPTGMTEGVITVLPTTPATTPAIVDPCNCTNDGICDLTTKKCRCFDGYYGYRCHLKRQDCSCVNNGICNTTTNICSCPSGYSGTHCEVNDNVCNCTNNGTCDVATKVCSCLGGYSGPLCKVQPVASGGSDFTMLILIAICVAVVIITLIVVIIVLISRSGRSKKTSSEAPVSYREGDVQMSPNNLYASSIPSPPLEFENPNFDQDAPELMQKTGLPPSSGDYEEPPKKGSDVINVVSMDATPGHENASVNLKSFTPGELERDTSTLIDKD